MTMDVEPGAYSKTLDRGPLRKRLMFYWLWFMALASVWLLLRSRHGFMMGKTTDTVTIASSSVTTVAGVQKSEQAAQQSVQHVGSVQHVEQIPTKPLFPEKVAVIIETQVVNTLVPIMLHFQAILGPTWQMILFTDPKLFEMPPSRAFRRGVESGQIMIKHLPPDYDFSNHHAVSNWLLSPWLWEQLKDARRALLFQLDSIICANSEYSVDDFLEYDLVGAPIIEAEGVGYNGGLSLRNPKLMLQVATEVQQGIRKMKEFQFEDQYFFTQLQEMGANLPNRTEARKFSVETIWYEKSLGYHQVAHWQGGHMEEVERRCPEVKMNIGGRY